MTHIQMEMEKINQFLLTLFYFWQNISYLNVKTEKKHHVCFNFKSVYLREEDWKKSCLLDGKDFL